MRWLLPLLPLTFGLAVHLMTLWTTCTDVRDALRGSPPRRSSGVPIVGPLLITFGLWWCPYRVQAWVFLLPWGLEALALILALLVRRATKPA